MDRPSDRPYTGTVGRKTPEAQAAITESKQVEAGMLNLDTRMLIALVAGNASAAEAACAGKRSLVISEMVMWELANLVRKGYLRMDLNDSQFQGWLRQLRVLPISSEIARQSIRLDFSSDPVDEIIAATSVVENIPLLTRNPRIRRSRMVPLAPY